MERSWPTLTNIPPASSSARRSRRIVDARPPGGSSPRDSPSDGPSPCLIAMRVISAYLRTRRARRRNARAGCGSDASPCRARARRPGRVTNSVHTEAAITPSRQKIARSRGKSRGASERSDATTRAAATPRNQPMSPAATVDAAARRTPSRRPTSAPTRIVTGSAGTTSHRSPPSRSITVVATRLTRGAYPGSLLAGPGRASAHPP